ncbi:phosphodiester glycosidase family protein [Dysgonomonas sp.]
MKKIFLLIHLFSLFFSAAKAQTVEDSICISNINWTITDIANGIKVKQAQIKNLYKGVQHISIIEIDNGDLTYEIGTYSPDNRALKKTSEQAGLLDALVAINGTFFDMKNGGDVNFHKMNGITLYKTKSSEFEVRAKGAFCIEDNEYDIINWDEKIENDSLNNLQYDDILVSGPLLVYQNTIVKLEDTPFVYNKHPRSAVSIAQNGNLLFILFDGRHINNANGVNLYELAHFLKQIGAEKALNLDGGGSSTLYAKGFGENGIVNMPSDNKLFDHEGERKVASIIFVSKKK